MGKHGTGRASKTGAVLLMYARLGDLMEKRFLQYNRQKPVFSHTNLVAVEIMPGLVPSIIPYLRERLSQPLIMRGLISQIQTALDAGADAVSLSAAHLRNLETCGDLLTKN